MSNEPMRDAINLLDDPVARRVLEHLIKNMAVSLLRLSYDLKMDPDALGATLQKLEKARVVRTVATERTSQTYTPTEVGFALKEYLFRSGSSFRHYRR